MSTVEVHSTKLTPVDLRGQDLDSWIRELLHRDELKGYESSWVGALAEDRYGEYHYSKDTGVLYAVEDSELDPSGFLEASKKPDGSIVLLAGFYNGGVGFGEILDEAIARTEP